MQWTYNVLGTRTTLTRLVGVAAAYLGKDPIQGRARGQRIAGLGKEIRPDGRGSSVVSLLSPLAWEELKRFQRAGWVFVKARPEAERAALARRPARGLVVSPVFLSEAGRLLLGTALVTVQLWPNLSRAEAGQRLHAAGLRDVHPLLFARNLFEATLSAGPDLAKALQRLQDKLPEQLFIEPQLLEVIPVRMRPSDPQYGEQWQHENDGSQGGKAGADICSEAAWNLTLGRTCRRPIRLAVIDQGFQINHPDLQSGIVGGGFFQDRGPARAQFVPFQAGMSSFPNDDHGTFCLGMAGARADNGSGGCGSAPEADLLPIACLQDDVGTQATLARAVAYAANPRCEELASTALGADVISCSLGPSAPWQLQQVLDCALRFAAIRGRNGRGIPLFWAASDDAAAAMSQDQVCSHRGVIAVGVSDRRDRRGDCAFGPKLEFLAPGLDVASTRSGSHFGVGSGTSFAAPLAAGVAALVLSRHPRWTAHQVRRRLRRACDKIGGVKYVRGRNDHYGYGRINAARAVRG